MSVHLWVRNVQDFDAMVRYRPLIALACPAAAPPAPIVDCAGAEKEHRKTFRHEAASSSYIQQGEPK
jgi:hypothetical protein